MNRIRQFLLFLFIFLTGGLAYCALELIFRARTHYSMFIAGGLCVVLLYLISTRSRVPVWKKWIAAGAVITTVEFFTGIIVNIFLGMKVWDYSMMKMNLLGQICLYFSLFWVLLSIPVIQLFKIVDNRFAGNNHRNGE